MTSLRDQVVLITGASAGIGAACARAFAGAGARLILTARRRERLAALAKELGDAHGTACCVTTLDVRHRDGVDRFVDDLPRDWSSIAVLVNNAGLGLGMDKLQTASPADWDAMLDTNVKGLLNVTRAVLPGMLSRAAGHIINLGSLAGHEVYPGGAVYCASKYAVHALTVGLKHDLLGTPIRVTSVDPGLVETEFSQVRFKGDTERAAKVYQGLTPLSAADVAEVVLFCATRPAHVNIRDVVLMPVAQASTTHASRA